MLWKQSVLLLGLTVMASFPVAVANHGGQNQNYNPSVQNAAVKQVVSSSQESPATILARLMQANGISSQKIQAIEIVSTSELNASTDGKKIYMTSGLWNTLQTDDQRAFTISHELSHVAMNHVPKTQARRFGLSLLNNWLAKKTVDNSLVGLVRQSGISMVEMRFSRQAEYGADDLGLQMMKKAGYNPRAALEVFEIFEKSGTSKTPEFLRDHPLNKSRIAQLITKHQLTQ